MMDRKKVRIYKGAKKKQSTMPRDVVHVKESVYIGAKLFSRAGRRRYRKANGYSMHQQFRVE